MAKRIVIKFPIDRPHDYYTKVFWFAESLWHPVVNAGLGQLNDIDKARETLWIDLAANRHAAAVKAIIKKSLRKYSLQADAAVTTE